MATEVNAKLGLVITARDEASQIFKDFATKILENMQSATESIKPLTDAMKGMSEAVVGASNTTGGAQQKERDEIALTRQELLEWARDNEESFKAAGISANNFADVTTADLKRVYQSVEDTRVTVVKDLTAIAEATDGPVIASLNKWRETQVMSSNEIKTALQGIISKDETLENLTLLLTNENKSLWKGMYEDLTGVNVVLDRTNTRENELANNTKKIADGFGSMSKASSLQMVGSTIEDLGTKVVGFGAHAVEAGANFEQSITNATAALNTRLTPATKLTQDQIEAMSSKALDLGKAGFFSANQLADAMAIMSKNGMDYKEVMGGAISSVQNLAGATGSELSETARTMTDIYNEYGDEVKKFGSTTEEQFDKVADLVTGAMSNSSISMQNFLDSMKYLGPVAGGLGMSLTDVATGISLVGKAGVQGSSAGTYFRAMLADLTGATKPAIEKMQELGIITKEGTNQFFNQDGTVKSLAQQHEVLTATLGKLNPAQQDAAMKTMFGMRSLAGMNAVLHTSKDELSTLTGIVDKNGTAFEVASAKMDTSGGRLMILKSNFETLQKEIGISLLPVLESLMSMGESMISWFSKMPDPMKDVVIGLTALAGATLFLSGKIMNTISMYQFFKIAMSDLIHKRVEDTVATGEQTAAQQAQTVVTEEATIAREGLNVATGEGVVATEGAIVATEGASAATGLFGAAIAAVTSPIGIAVIAIAGIGTVLYELYQHFKPVHDALDRLGGALKGMASDAKSFFWGTSYAKDIENMSNKSVANVVTMTNTVLTKLEEFKISSTGISSDTAKSVVAASNSMYDQIVKKADERHTAELNDATLLKNDLGKVGQETYKTMVQNADKEKTETVAKAKEMNDKVNAEIADMQKKGIKVTSAMKDQLIKDFENARDGAVKALSDSEVQQQVVLEKLKHESGQITAEIAQQTVKDAITARDGAVKAANDKYDADMKAIIRERNDAHPISQAQAADMIQAAQQARDGATKAANDTYTQTLNTVKKQHTDIVKEVNMTTGDMLTGWEKFKKSIMGIFSSISSAMSNVFGGSHTTLPSMPTNIPGYNAQGSDYYNGGPTWVGEDGPELIDLPKGTKITPHQTSVNRMVDMGTVGGGASNKTQTNNITINVNGVGKNGTQIGQDIAKQLRLQIPIVT